MTPAAHDNRRQAGPAARFAAGLRMAHHLGAKAAAALSAAGVWLARRLDRGYVQALGSKLSNRAVELDYSQVTDPTTRLPVLRTKGLKPVSSRVLAPAAPGGSAQPAPTEAERQRPRPLEPIVQRLADLRSGRPARVRAALARPEPLDPLVSAQAISLLAWDEVSGAARAALIASAPRLCGQLVDFLLDESQDFAIRRRIPPVLASCGSARAADGLAAALADSRFEVRFQSARALLALSTSHPELRVPPAAVFAAVDRELSVGRSVWDSHRLLDRREPTEQMQFLDEILRERAHVGLEHVFTLLALALQPEPLKIAFRALHTDDPLLRGLGLEYLETVLPEGIREKLSRIVERSKPGGRTGEETLATLMRSSESIVALLKHRLAQP